MNKAVKKLIALIMAGTLCFSLTACGGGSDDTSSVDTSDGGAEDTDGSDEDSASEDTQTGTGEVETVVVCMPTYYDSTDVGQIEAAVNELIEDEYGLNIELTMVNFGSWQEQSNLLLTGNEVDIIAIYATPLTTYVSNGQLTDLTAYYDGASDAFKEVWSESELGGTTVNNSLYAIPNLRNFGNRVGLNIDEEIAAEFGIEAGQALTMDDIDVFLREVNEAYPDRYAIVPQSSDSMVGAWTWDGLGDGNFIGVLPERGQVTEVQNLFETDDFQNFVSYSRSWYEDGLMMQDALSNTENGRQLIQAGKAISCFDNYGVNEVAGCIRTVVVEEWSVANSYSELCYGINGLSDRPDAAWKMMEILYTNEEVGILINNGIEDQHYVMNDDGTVSFPEGQEAADTGWGMSDLYWVTPYSGNAYPLDVNGPTFYEDLIQFNEETLKSKAHGFYFDTSEVVDQYSACTNIMEKYYKALLVGAVDPDATIVQANGELEAAGLSDIIEAKQAQLDEFLAQ